MTDPDRSANPRPLGFHIMVSAMTWNSAAAALPGFMKGLPMAHGTVSEAADALRAELHAAGPALWGAVSDAAVGRIQAVLQGITGYQHHPYRRSLGEPPAAFREGSLRLLDFAPDKAGTSPTIVAVPSLINPSYILDLAPGRSLMRHLADNGFRPLLVDWGTPTAEGRGFGLTDYITKRLEPALAWAAENSGGPVIALGYCMGGNLALAATARRPDLVSAMALLATPWDFHAESVTLNRAITTMFSGVLAALGKETAVPVDLLQLFFASLDPTLTDRKFRRFAALDPDSPAAELFVAIEDWANGGAPLAVPVAAECLQDWYGRNLPATAQWQVGDTVIDPAAIDKPALVIAPKSDRIVPPASALALADALPDAVAKRAPAGHVTMVVGPTAARGLWDPLVSWLQQL